LPYDRRYDIFYGQGAYRKGPEGIDPPTVGRPDTIKRVKGEGMKGIVSAILAVAVMQFFGGAAMAAEEALEGGPEVSVRVNTWVNEWKREAPDGESITSSTVVLVGPTIEVEFPSHFFAEASLLGSLSEYSFTIDDAHEDLTRRDVDLAVGYSFCESFDAFVGYRHSRFKETESRVEEISYGPLVGISSSVAVNDALSFYGKATYLITRLRVKGGEEPGKQDAPGWIGEIGVKYAFTNQIAADLGYKYEYTKTDDSDIEDTFQGLTAGLSYLF